jgi:hypothetical protein
MVEEKHVKGGEIQKQREKLLKSLKDQTST